MDFDVLSKVTTVTAWNRIECMSNTPWLENEKSFGL
jgi:hypothetical protein